MPASIASTCLAGYRGMVSVSFFFSSRRRHTRSDRDWSSDVCSSDLYRMPDIANLSRFLGGIEDAAAKKTRKVGNIGHPVLRAAGDEDGSAAHRSAIDHVDGVRPTLTVEPCRVPGHAQLRPELLCLSERPTGERCARNAGRKSQIVFDPGARSGLAAGSEGLHEAHVQAFGGCIHGGGKTRRARP